jgi:hypothetical protein
MVVKIAFDFNKFFRNRVRADPDAAVFGVGGALLLASESELF